jgi:hypothetical protein
MEMVPELVIVPPDNPAPALIEVNVPKDGVAQQRPVEAREHA